MLRYRARISKTILKKFCEGSSLTVIAFMNGFVFTEVSTYIRIQVINETKSNTPRLTQVVVNLFYYIRNLMDKLKNGYLQRN